ncbi:MAG: outer membrane lipoprotein-sorting protein [Saprospiraceae bacterium]
MNFKKMLFFGSFMIIGHCIFAQTADEIINKYFESTGGRDAWSKITSMKSAVLVKTQGMELPAVMLSKPMKQKIEITFQGLSIVQPAFDGETGWQTNFMTMKAEKMEAEDNAITKSEVGDFPDPFLKYKEKGYNVELQGSETVEGTDCFKIKLTKKPVMIDGKEEENASIYFFDKENFVPIMVRNVVKKGPAKGKSSETAMSDYQEVNGLMMPFTMDQKFEGTTQASISVKTIELNVAIDDSVFKFPEGN